MTESTLKELLSESMKSAMKAKDKDRLKTIRLALSDIKRVEVDTREEQSDSQIIAILDKMVKQRRESIKQFELGGRPELAAQEQLEIEVLNEFLPKALSDDEIDSLIQSTITDSGAETIKDMGKVMGLIKPKVIGRADLSLVSKKIKDRLSWNSRFITLVHKNLNIKEILFALSCKAKNLLTILHFERTGVAWH